MTVVHTPKAGETSAASPTAALPPGAAGDGTEVLFREAKRRERRRRLFALAVVVIALGGAGVGYAVSSGTGSHPALSSPGTGSQPTVPTAVGGPLKDPYGLAVANDGDLYIVDIGRDQVLRRLASGRFQVVAGDGHRGFSGDGGPAPGAELNLRPSSAIVMAKDGTLYIADSGNERVRAVLPDGMIKTVAGDGSPGRDNGLILRTTPALAASFGAPSGLAFGPNGDLYIAAGNVVRLTPNGLIEWVAGAPWATPACGSIYCNPASEADFAAPDQLAFDGAGDLFVAVDNGPSLYEIAANGRLTYVGQFRAGGGGRAGALAQAPDGTVVEAGQVGLARLPASGKFTMPKPLAQALALGEPIPGNLDQALGPNKRLFGGYNIFYAGDGVAVGPNGAVYADTSDRYVSSVSALLEVQPGGKVLTLWKS